MDDLNIYTSGQLGLIALDSCSEIVRLIDRHIRVIRNDLQNEPASYIVPIDEIRFSNGEGKTRILETVRGKDIYIFCDIGNHSCFYKMYGKIIYKSPDEHFQDIKRALSAIAGKARRITVVMPLLYASRQDKRKGRESLDCAMALQDLEKLGVNDIITFDVHNDAVQNALSLCSFDNLYSSYDIVGSFINDNSEIIAKKDDLLVISPDTGGMERAIYYSSVLGVDVGLFYKRRDYSRLENGKHPIVQHEYVGRDVEGKNVIIIDDMISSGESVIDLLKELKRRKAGQVFIAATFAFFTEGPYKFNRLYEEGYFTKLYTTNLTYVPSEVKMLPWYREVDMSAYIAKIVNYINNNHSIAPLLDSTHVLRGMIEEIRNEQ